jgi:hypothetical protein
MALGLRYLLRLSLSTMLRVFMLKSYISAPVAHDLIFHIITIFLYQHHDYGH